MINFLVSRRRHRGRTNFCGMHREPAVGFALDMELELCILGFEWNLQAGERLCQTSRHSLANFALDFLPRRTLDGRDGRIAGPCNESAFRLRLDLVGVLSGNRLDVHLARLYLASTNES